MRSKPATLAQIRELLIDCRTEAAGDLRSEKLDRLLDLVESLQADHPQANQPQEHAPSDHYSNLRPSELRLRDALSRAKKSEESFRTVVQSSPVGMIRLDSNLRFKTVNPAFIRLSGYSEEELLQLSILDICHPDEKSKSLEKVRDLSRVPGTLERFEKRYITKTGQVIWVMVQSELTFDAQTGECVFVSVIEDVTENRRLQNWSKSVIESASYAIITTTPDGMISTFNRAAEQLLGFCASEVVGKITPKIFHDMDEIVARSEQLTTELGRVIQPGPETFFVKARMFGSDTFEMTYIHRDQTRIPVRICMTLINDQAGEFVGCLAIAEDLRELKKLEAAYTVEKAKSLHSAKLASLGEMSAGIAHEINNPLAIVMGNIPLLSKFKSDSEKFAAKLEAITKASYRIDKIVKGLRKFSRSSDGVVHKPESLKEIVKEAVNITEAKSKRHSTPIELCLSSDAKISCDAVEIEQVLINLINNGIDATKDLDTRWLRIYLFEESYQVYLRVMDSGAGITKEVEEKLFLPFFTTKAIGEGTGLGLSITKGILDSHQASLKLNRSFEHTCFEICFPKTDG